MKEGRVDKEINNNIDIKKMRNVEERDMLKHVQDVKTAKGVW